MKRVTGIAAIVLASGLVLSACTGGGTQPTETVTETTTATSEVTQETQETPQTQTTDADVAEPAPQPGTAPAEGVPSAATGYTAEARAEMAEDNITEQEIADALAAAVAGSAEVEWEDDGYWEVEYGELDVDIFPNGVVRDVDR